MCYASLILCTIKLQLLYNIIQYCTIRIVNKNLDAVLLFCPTIHDIGKNIVKVILENYGFPVIDLGRDVPAERVVQAVREHSIRLVGLSALMTTTLKSMEETIALLHQQQPDCKIMVGGAVLTEEYAKKIGADFYAKDAKASADIARSVLL